MKPGNGIIPSNHVLGSGVRLCNYEIRELLGYGYAGFTYLACNLDSDTEVVIKEYFPWPLAARADGRRVIPCDRAAEPDFGWGLRRFIELGQGLTRLRCRSVVTAEEIFELDGSAYIVTPYINGPTLAAHLALAPPPSEQTLMSYLLPLLADLKTIHEAGYFHRDIRVDNLCLDSNGHAVLVDFGTSIVSRSRSGRRVNRADASSTAAGAMSGVLRKGPWADIQGVAKILLALITGQAPDSVTPDTSIYAAQPPSAPRLDAAHGDAYSERFLTAVNAGLAANFTDRPLTVASWLAMFVASDRACGGSLAHLLTPMPEPMPRFSFEPAGAATPQSAPLRESAETLRGSISSPTVLVVDDEPFQCKILLTLLAQIGINDACAVHGAREALKKLQYGATAFDVVICDLRMPDMDGLEFIRRMSAFDHQPKIVFASGVDQSILDAARNFAEVREMEVLGTLTKPIDRRQVATLLLRRFDEAPPLRRPVPTTDRHDSLSFEEVASGLENGALTMFYQPKIAVETNTVAGFEALARWRDPVRGLLGPGEFLHAIEEGALLEQFTGKVIEATLRDVGAWANEGLDIQVSINIPAEVLSDYEFPGFVMETASASGVRPDQITLELTKSAVARDAIAAMEILTRFRLNGLTLSIDDFGTGYASLDKLKYLPFTELKIDRVFVHGATDNHNARVLLETAIDLGRKLKLDIVAEGVEDQADWDLVAELGCNTVQGFYVARPMAADQVSVWLYDWTQSRPALASGA